MSKHKVISTTKQEPRTETTCAQPGCKFKGKPAQQGVCYTAKGHVVEFAALDRVEREITADLKAMRKREGKSYVRVLEAHYTAAMMNWEMTLDECIRLRRDVALAKVRKP